MKKKAVLLAVVAVLLLPASGAAVTVEDWIAWAQRLIEIYNQGQQLAKQGEQIYAEYRQLEALVKGLESFVEEGDFSDLHGLLGQLDQIFNQASELADNVGYLTVGVERIYRNSFPGYRAPEFGPVAEWQSRIQTAQDTLALIIEASNRLTWNNTRSQITLAAAVADSKAADGPLEEAEVSNMFASLAVTEAQKTLQAQLLTANAVVVGFGTLIQSEASATRARSDWLDGAYSSTIPPSSATGAYTGVPSSFASSSLF